MPTNTLKKGDEQIHLARQIRKSKIKLSKHEEKNINTIIDSLLRIISNLSISSESTTSQQTKQEKLESHIKICRSKCSNPEELQRAIMEIPELSPTGDPASVEALSGLLSHDDKYVRHNARKSIGLIASESAEEILSILAESEDDETRSAAFEALQQSNILGMIPTFKNEHQNRIMGLIENVTEQKELSYNYAFKSLKIIYILLLGEIILALSLIIWRLL